MSEENSITELPEDIEVIGPGQMLAEARNTLKLTQQDVADKLNFRVTLVKDIEADKFDDALPATFNRGYLKNYAKLVNISTDEVLTAYDTLNVAQLQCAEMQSFSKQTEKQAESNIVMWISYLILALLVGSTILWWSQDVKDSEVGIAPLPTSTSANKGVIDEQPIEKTLILDKTNISTLSETLKESPNVNTNIAQPDTNVEKAKTATANDLTDLANNQVASIATNNVAVNPESTSTNVTVPASNISATDNIASEEVADDLAVDFGPLETATFTFSGDCWVNIYDATGERIAWGIKKSGYVMNISGQAPFSITLGKPELVSINFAEETIDMTQFSRGNIAKFNLPIK